MYKKRFARNKKEDNKCRYKNELKERKWLDYAGGGGQFFGFQQQDIHGRNYPFFSNIL
jgi:hypothetical protein